MGPNLMCVQLKFGTISLLENTKFKCLMSYRVRMSNNIMTKFALLDLLFLQIYRLVRIRRRNDLNSLPFQNAISYITL